jgi:hypothetical protein
MFTGTGLGNIFPRPGTFPPGGGGGGGLGPTSVTLRDGITGVTLRDGVTLVVDQRP